MFRVPLHLLCLLLAALLLASCSSPPPSLMSAALTDKVDEQTMAPLNPVTSFPKSAKTLFVSTLVANPKKDTRVEARWFFDKESKGSYLSVDQASVTFDSAGKNRYVAFRLDAVTEFQPGTYKVELYLDDKLTKELTFAVN